MMNDSDADIDCAAINHNTTVTESLNYTPDDEVSDLSFEDRNNTNSLQDEASYNIKGLPFEELTAVANTRDNVESSNNDDVYLTHDSEEERVNPSHTEGFGDFEHSPEDLERSSDSRHRESDNDQNGSPAADSIRPGAFFIPGMRSQDDNGEENSVDITANVQQVSGHIINDAFLVFDGIAQIIPADKKNRYYAIFCSLVFVIAAISFSLVFSLKRDMVQDLQPTVPTASTTSPSETPLNVLSVDDLKMIILNKNISAADDLDDKSTSQMKALLWIANETFITQLDEVNVDKIIQRYIVVVLYYALNGTYWYSQNGFLTEGLHECDWYKGVENGDGFLIRYGIGCDFNDNVRRISLENNNVSGTIPNEIGHLVHLIHINLGQNNIQGTIPSSIGSLSLDFLKLSFNNLSGTIPLSVAAIGNDIKLANVNLEGVNEFCAMIGKDVVLEIFCDLELPSEYPSCKLLPLIRCCQVTKTAKIECCENGDDPYYCYDPTLRWP